MRLFEIAGSRIAVHIGRNFSDTRKRVQNAHIGARPFHFFRVKDIAVLQTQIILFVEEALALNAGHVKNVEVGNNIVK